MIDVVVLFFVLGVLARVMRSDLRIPEALYETLSIYLLLAIGLKGGLELSKRPLADLAPEIVGVVLLSFCIPLIVFPFLRVLRFGTQDAGAIAGHYGSVSVVTYAVAVATLSRAAMGHEAHAALWVALMEGPGLVSGILLARSANLGTVRWGAIARDVLCGKSVVLLLGGLTIGAIAGEEGVAPIAPVFLGPFKGVLAFFLLELGLVAGGKLGALRQYGFRLLVVGLGLPPVLGLLGVFLGSVLGLETGGAVLLGTLAASASYIAAPTAMRIAVPEADAALSITAALAITFPFNLIAGIPLYIAYAEWLVPGGIS